MHATDLLRLLAGLALTAPLAACGDEEAMMVAEEDYDEAPCTVDPGDFALHQDTASETGLYSVRILDATPAPPRKNVNLWTVELVGPDGNALEDATLDDVQAWMPAHRHDGRYPTVITPMGGGKFEVDVINLWMGGGWQVKFNATVEDRSEQAIVEVCVPG